MPRAIGNLLSYFDSCCRYCFVDCLSMLSQPLQLLYVNIWTCHYLRLPWDSFIVVVLWGQPVVLRLFHSVISQCYFVIAARLGLHLSQAPAASCLHQCLCSIALCGFLRVERPRSRAVFKTANVTMMMIPIVFTLKRFVIVSKQQQQLIQCNTNKIDQIIKWYVYCQKTFDFCCWRKPQ